MFDLMMKSLLATFLDVVAVLIVLVGVFAYGTFAGVLIALPFFGWASVLKFQINHTVYVVEQPKVNR